jgi:hypothetical protein
MLSPGPNRFRISKGATLKEHLVVWGTVLREIGEVTVGVIAGVAITRRYARQASDELKREAGRMRHYVDVLVGFLESMELDPRVLVERDETGRLTNIRVQRSAATSGRESSRAEPTSRGHPGERVDAPQDDEIEEESGNA